MNKKSSTWIKRLVFVLPAMVLLFSAISVRAETRLVITQERAVLREGPGSFYDIVAELPPGSVVRRIGEKQGWYHVVRNGHAGFLSPRMTRKATPRQSALEGMIFESADTDVSRHVMSAGVRGFGDHFTERFGGDPSFIDFALAYRMDPEKYLAFRKDIYKAADIGSIRKAVPIPPKNAPDDYTLAEQGLGLAVASKIAAKGIYRDPMLQEYVNQVGNLLVEGSDVFDTPFLFFILDIDSPNAYATPSGVIFITRGMLQLIDSEAQLALVLGHEIAHTARFHGVIELAERKPMIDADRAVAEMDRLLEAAYPGTLSAETRALIEEMEDLSFRVFETLIQGRLDQYEEEADFLAMIYAMRAGYAPWEMTFLLENRIASDIAANNAHYTRAGSRQRVEKALENLEKMTIPHGLKTHRQRYKDRLQGL